MTDLKQKTLTQTNVDRLEIKGKLSYSELPTTGITVGDVYIITDRDNLPYMAIEDYNNNIVWVQLNQFTNGYVKNQFSYIFGNGLVSVQDNQFILGQYNAIDTSGNYLQIVGNGSGNSNRRNVFAIQKNGDVRIKGNVYINANDDSSGGTNLATELVAKFG